mmetsp:Transcript_74969/g.147184  ORF Transcript_74969/g.147184 Transcript_74969/m.147184 type:complete len:598 (+) Transcript_74969:1-1794(+)
MKDIMEKTNTELKNEMHQLRHKGTFSPDKVVARALDVGNHVLFPRLERTFGIAPSPLSRAGTSALHGAGANIFPSEFGTSSGGAGKNTTGESLFGRTDDIIAPSSADAGLRITTAETNAAATSAALGGRRQSHSHENVRGKAAPVPREFDPLPIQTMTQDRLQASLTDSKMRVLGAFSTNKLDTGNNRHNITGTAEFFDNFGYDDDDDDNDRGPVAILKLPRDDVKPASVSPSGNSAKRQLSKSKALESALSPGSQSSASLAIFLPPTPKGASSATAGPGRGSGKDNASPSAAAGAGGHVRTSSAGKNRSGKLRKSKDQSEKDDVKLPIFTFDPLRDSSGKESKESKENSCERGGNGLSGSPSERHGPSTSPTAAEVNSAVETAAAAASSSAPVSLSKKFRSSFGAEIRTDVNDKATFLEPPPGKFRREFSNDHPLAKGGTGKYHKELRKGVTPAGLDVEVPEHLTRSSSNVAETLGKASKIERLTYTAQQRVVDPKSKIEELKRQQNETLRRIVMEERDAEAAREQTLKTLADPQERQNLEGVFSEERKRASDRIIEATRQHEEAMKAMVLSMMDLGVGTLGYGKEDTRLPMGNFF